MSSWIPSFSKILQSFTVLIAFFSDLKIFESNIQDKVVEFGGLDHVIHCLGRSPNVSKAAIELLFELLLDGSGWNSSLLNLLAQKNGVFIFLVALLNGTITESAAKAEAILLKLCDGNDDNISRAADANWYKPLINRLCQG